MNCSKPIYVKHKPDGKILQVRCCELPNNEPGDFDVVFQYYYNGKWIIDNSICSPNYSFYVPEDEIKGVQVLMDI
jgi:hypothetical protein